MRTLRLIGLAIFVLLTTSVFGSESEKTILMTQDDLIEYCNDQVEKSLGANDYFRLLFDIYGKSISEGFDTAGGANSCCGFEHWQFPIPGLETVDAEKYESLASHNIAEAISYLGTSGDFDAFFNSYDFQNRSQYGFKRLVKSADYSNAQRVKSYLDSGADGSFRMEFFVHAEDPLIDPDKVGQGSRLAVFKLSSDPIVLATNLVYRTVDKDADSVSYWPVDSGPLFSIPDNFSCRRKMEIYGYGAP